MLTGQDRNPQARYLILLTISLLLFSSSSPAQGRHEQDNEGLHQLLQPVSFEAITLFGRDTAKAIVNIHYRIGGSFFIFVRNEVEQRKTEYVARGELVIELLNEQKNSAARKIKQILLTRPAPARETDRSLDIQGAMSFAVPKGTYQIVLSLDDRESGRTYLDRNKKVTVAEPSPAQFEIAQLLFVQPVGTTLEAGFIPLNRGGDLQFGGKGGIISQLRLPDSALPPAVQWKLEGRVDGLGQRMEKFEGSELVLLEGLLHMMTQEDEIRYRVDPAAKSWQTPYIPLPLERLEPGSYRLDIEFMPGQAKRRQTLEFRVLWQSRPLSLINPDLAVDALRHIASEEEMNEMQSGSATRRAGAFRRFWRAKDRDTTTAYNEIMTEYYLRVDEALRKFSTLKEGDGYKTDRGRIFILYGPPTKSDRIFQPGAPPTEVWSYEHLKRKFVFIDPNKSGTFILNQTENL